MNKVVNIVLQLIFVVAFAGVAVVMQGAGGGYGSFSSGQAGIVALCVPMCWIVFRYYDSVRFYFTAIVLALGFLGGYLISNMNGGLSGALSEHDLSGYAIALFMVFLFCGTAMICSNRKLGLIFIPGWKMPLAGWLLVALALDFAVKMLFFEQNIGLVLLQVKAGALAVGLSIGLLSKIASIVAYKATGTGLERLCFVGYVPPKEEVRPSAEATIAPSASPAPMRPGGPTRPGGRPAVPTRPGGRPAVPTRPGGRPAAPSMAKVKSPKASVLDAKLEALCSPSGKGDKADNSGEEELSKTPPNGPATSETGKIVSSVDFG